MEKKYTIYKLIDPITNDIRYIGLTFNTLKQRLKSHLSDPGGTHKGNWIRKIKRNNLRPIIDAIEDNIPTLEMASEKEIFYIKKFTDEGHRLTNSSTGGHNTTMSLETRIKMSESAKNRKIKFTHSEETKKKMSHLSKKRFSKKSQRDLLSISNKRYEDSKTEEQKINDILIQKCKPIVQYDKDMNRIDEYYSSRDAERKTGIGRSNIVKCCKGLPKHKSAGGFIWKYKESIDISNI